MSNSDSAPLTVRLKGLLHRKKSDGSRSVEDSGEIRDPDSGYQSIRGTPSRPGAAAHGDDGRILPFEANNPPTPPPKDRKTLRKVRRSGGNELDSESFNVLPIKQLSFEDSISESELRRDLARTSIDQESSETSTFALTQ